MERAHGSYYDRRKIWRKHTEGSHNFGDQITKVDVVEESFQMVTREEIIRAMKDTKLTTAFRLFEVNTEMIIASGIVGIAVMLDPCQHVLDGNGMPDEWEFSVVAPILKERGNVILWPTCGSYREIKFS